MTGPIVVGPDGLRYRSSIPWPQTCQCEEPKLSAIVASYVPMGKPPLALICDVCRSFQHGVLEALPAIPDWPLPGPAPQFLSDDPSVGIGEGDIAVYVTIENGVFVDAYFARFQGDRNPTLGQYHPQDMSAWTVCYLIARADPEADA